MTKRVKLMLAIVAFGVVMFGATMLYENLKATVLEPSSSSSEQNESGDTSDSSDSSDSDEIYLDDFTIEDLEGNKVSFSEFEGKAAVINFWATWCVYCKQEMPDFNEVYNDYKDENVEFMMINVEDGIRETKEKAVKYIEEEGFDFPVYIDYGGKFYSEFGQRSLPITIVVDKDHNVVRAFLGAVPKETLEEIVKEIIQ